MNIRLQVKKNYYKVLRALTIISKVTVSVSKYKPLSVCVIIVFLFYNGVVSSSKQFNIINRKLLRVLTIIIIIIRLL